MTGHGFYFLLLILVAVVPPAVVLLLTWRPIRRIRSGLARTALRAMIIGFFITPAAVESGHVLTFIPAYWAGFELLTGQMNSRETQSMTAILISMGIMSLIAFAIGSFVRARRWSGIGHP